MDKWMTLADAAAELGVSERTVRRRIGSTLIGEKRDGKWMVKLNTESAEADKTAELEKRIQEQEKQLQEMEGWLQLLKQRIDGLSGAVDGLHRLMAYSSQPFWRKLFRKQLPPPVVDVEDDDI